jgi:hypothetical protein
LAGTLEQEEQLRRQGIALYILIEARQERVGFGILQQQGRRVAVSQLACKRGLAAADRAFDDDMRIFVG